MSRHIILTVYCEETAKPNKVWNDVKFKLRGHDRLYLTATMFSTAKVNGKSVPVIHALRTPGSDGFLKIMTRRTSDLEIVMNVSGVLRASYQTSELELFTFTDKGQELQWAVEWPEAYKWPKITRVNFPLLGKTEMTIRGRFGQAIGVWVGWTKLDLFEMKVDQLPPEKLEFEMGGAFAEDQFKLSKIGKAKHFSNRKPELVMATWPHPTVDEWTICVPFFT